MHNGEWEQAEVMLARALTEQSHTELATYALGAVQLHQGKDPLPYWQQGDIGYRLLQLGDECAVQKNQALTDRYYHVALEVFASRRELIPAEVGRLVEYFAGTADQAAFDQALAVYAEHARGDMVEYHHTLGRAYLIRKEYEQALHYLQLACAAEPDDVMICYDLARVYLELKAYDQMTAVLTQVVRREPEHVLALTMMGQGYFYQQQYNQAADWYNQALMHKPDHVQALRGLLQVRLQQERFEEAYPLALRLIELDPRAYTRILAAQAAAGRRDFDQALMWLEEGRAIDADNIELYRQQARICEEMNAPDCLRSAYTNILRLDPADRSAQQRLDDLMRSTP